MSSKILNVALAAALAVSFAACSDDPENEEKLITISAESLPASDFNAENYWTKCYDESAESFTVNGFRFSHEASSMEWGGITYYSWKGFCPSRSSDTADYSASGDWTDHQFASIAAKPLCSPYIIGFWDVSTDTPESPACSISREDGASFTPASIEVSNTSWDYYALVNGSAYSKPFAEGDYFYLIVHGMKDGRETGTVKITLATGAVIYDTWMTESLADLGYVDSIYFTLESSDTGDWGMNNPAYFCINNLKVKE